MSAVEVISGKVAIITGAAAGIGEAYVRRLFKGGMKGCTIADKDEKGAALAKEMQCCYGKCSAKFIQADVTDAEQFENVFKEHMDTYKQLDLLVNNAGIMKDGLLDKMIDVNVTATVGGTLLGIKFMGKNNSFKGGTIVNTASVVGLKPWSTFPVYAGTKHFVVGFTRSMGTKYWYDLTGIRFMTICPGLTSTALISDVDRAILRDFPTLEKRAIDQLSQNLKLLQSVENVAETLNKMLNEGTNGSIWVIGAGVTFEVKIPSIYEMKVDPPNKNCS